jgi:hypothetical protein
MTQGSLLLIAIGVMLQGTKQSPVKNLEEGFYVPYFAV